MRNGRLDVPKNYNLLTNQTIHLKPFSDDWFNVLALPEPNSGCWLWCGYVDELGYGRVKSRPVSIRMHRWVYEHFIGEIPKGKYVLHRCDVRSCVNTDHLFLGTHLDNIKDAVSKGRQAKGERISSAKLTEQQVLAIRTSKETQSSLAEKYGI